MLEEYRRQIDIIDDEIIELLLKRDEIIKDVKKYKQTNKIDIYDGEREQKIYSRIKSKDLEIESDIIKIYELITNLSKVRQK